MAAHKYQRNQSLCDTEKVEINSNIATWQEHLGNLSWPMRSFGEYVARKAEAIARDIIGQCN